MKEFFILEAGLITVCLFLLAVTAFTSSRSFMPKHGFKRTVPAVFIFLSLIIVWHYTQTKERMETVKAEFENGKMIVCDNKGDLTLGRNVLVDKTRYGWKIDEFYFVSPEFPRKFHISRCVVEIRQQDYMHVTKSK